MQRSQRPFARRRRAWLRATVAVALLWLASLASVLVWALFDDAQPADSIIVLGAAQYRGKPSPVLRARLDHAVALWGRGLATRLVLTGGIGDGDSVSEAAVGRAYVVRAGVSDSAVLLENEGRTSSQSLRAAADQLRARGLNRAIVVSDPFHMLRLEILARRYHLTPFTSPVPGKKRLWRQWGALMAESVKAPLSFFLDW